MTTKKKKNRRKTPREEKLFENLLRVTYEFVRGKHYTPLTHESLLERLRIHPDHFAIFEEVLRQLKEEGKVQITKERYVPPVDTEKVVPDMLVGTIKVHIRGFGFVESKDSSIEDVFIPKAHINGAIDGDTVEVYVQQITEKGPEGRVVSIVERKRKQLLAIVIHTHEQHAICYSSLLGDNSSIEIPLKKGLGYTFGDRIVVEITEWGQKNTPSRGKFVRFIGALSDASKDIEAALVEYAIASSFPKTAVEEAKKFGKKVAKKDLQDREDLRDLECVTIDPDTAKDYDDAISVTREKDMRVLGVHIADVSHYITPGSALDREAISRMNSTYFPRYCVPMLPHELSDNLCSLKEGVIRLTMSVFMYFDSAGNMQHYRVVRGYIKSQKRFTYKEAKAVLDGKRKSKHAPLLKEMQELMYLLKQKRKERGSVELYMPELYIHVDDTGNPTHTEMIDYDETHQMVEEFMLRANETVATHLAKQGKNVTYRVHEEPMKENLRDFAVLARAFGYNLPYEPTPFDIQNVFQDVEGTRSLQYLATCYIKSMKLACYSADNVGHYGLGLTHYCHFTSPIRRYVDIVAHRLLFTQDSPNKDEFDAICTHASERERISARAETSVVVLKKLRLLASFTEKDARHLFRCVVTKIKPFGIYFDVVDLMLEGFLHVSELENDYYVYDEKGMKLVGRYGNMTYLTGDVIYVRVNKIDFVLRDVTWNMAHSEGKNQKKRPQAKKRRSKKR